MVIGIIVLLLGISVPIALRLTAGSHLMDCEANLHKIHHALRMYRQNEGGFPPYYFQNGEIHGRGLLALVDLGYLRSFETLRCPSDKEDYAAEMDLLVPGHNSGDPATHDPVYGYDYTDAVSYQWIDPNGTADPTGAPAFRYMSDRGVASSDPDIDRIPWDGRGSTYQPDDTTVLTWCPFHEKVITEGSKTVSGDEVPSGQYLVLYYGVGAEKKHSYLFRDGNTSTAPPESAWRVWPKQWQWSSGSPQYLP